MKTENPDIFSDTNFRLDVDPYLWALVSLPRFVVLVALDMADFVCLIEFGLTLLRLSILGVFAVVRRFRLVRDRDNDPIKEFL